MSDPFYVRQTAEPADIADPSEWFRQALEEAKREGATFARFTIADDRSALLIEAWTEQPSNQGEQRWSFAA